MGAIALASAAALAIWLGVDRLAAPVAGLEAPAARLGFAVGCICLAAIFCLVPGIEAVAHERLASPAIDPLAGYETRRLRVNQRYLQNTLEQFAVFAPALLGLAWYSADGRAMRAVEATTAVWILARLAFWLGYHRDSLLRALGAPGMGLGMIVLVYDGCRFGHDLAGVWGGAAVLVLFIAAEAALFALTWPPVAPAPRGD
jgi:uncharacterized MAPEG superfamily protein